MNDTYDYDNYSDQLAARTALQRASFIRKTYLHLVLALAAFAGLEYFLLQWSGAETLAQRMVEGKSWAVVLLLFMGVSWVADKWARNATSKAVQYAGLGLYVAAMSVLCMPLLLIANAYFPGLIAQAAVLTGAMVLGLTCVVFFTRIDFSFLRASLIVVSWIVLGLIMAAVLFGFELGLWFAVGMIVFVSVTILYQTSAIMRDYRDDQYVSAALGLFSSVVILFYYILITLMRRR